MSEKQIIEINGVKVEVDLREAKTIDTIRVGDKVKLLIKSYGDSYEMHHGVVVGFEPFPDRPAIIVAYMKVGYNETDLKLMTITGDSKNIQMIKTVDDELFSKTDAISGFEKEIAKHEREIENIHEKMAYFERHFGAYWEPVKVAPSTDPF